MRNDNDQDGNPLEFPVGELSDDDLATNKYKTAGNIRVRVQPECIIRILPRSEEELKLMQDWYLELPTPERYSRWTLEHVFAHLYHVNGSPFKMEALSPEELAQKREPFQEAYHQFFVSTQTRTPELLARIERTNELAAQILEHAKQPDSTISQNMVEFIQLRSFLVDMRYAENEEAEEAAFQGLMDFIDQSQDKELWVSFFHEIGLSSIQNFDHFPWQKVFQYNERFAERFQIPKRGVIN